MSEDPKVALEISYMNPQKVNDLKFKYDLSKVDLGPFDLEDLELKKFIQSTTSFRLTYNFKIFVPYSNIQSLQCYSWNIIQKYAFDKRAHFILSLDIFRSNCEDKNFGNVSGFSIFINKLLWIHIVVIILAVASFFLTWKYIYKVAKMYWKIKQKLKSIPATSGGNDREDGNNQTENINSGQPKSKWDMLKTGEKRKFFNKWSIICLLGNIVQIFGTILSLINSQDVDTPSEVLIGFGCMLAYINIGRYLDYNKDYSTIYATITRALPNVMRYLLGVLPIFFGFIFFGLCLFWRSERFTSTSSTMMTLFAVLNGDSVFDVFNDVAGVSFFLGQIYCYTFCIVFIV